MHENVAVAMKYNRDKPAPFITAKGRGWVAERIKEIARQEGIPLNSDLELVEFLFSMEIGSFIPEELYQVVAEIYAFVVEMQEEYEKY